MLLTAAIAFALGAGTAVAQTTDPMAVAKGPNEKDRWAPVDYGFGPGVKPRSNARQAQVAALPASMQVPQGGPLAGTQGVFGAAITWPMIPIHMVLLPDGRVLNYGTDLSGNQGSTLYYDVWDPSLGSDSNSHMVLPNTTATDIFCSAQTYLWQSNTVLITGGDLTINGQRNYSTNATTLFTPANNTVANLAPMQTARWYPTTVSLPSGEVLVLAGRSGASPTVAALTPEIFNPSTGWRTLTGATSTPAFNGNWHYPRAFLSPSGLVYILHVNGWIFSLSTSGTGAIGNNGSKYKVSLPTGDFTLPSVMYAPGKILSIRTGSLAYVVDINGSQPVLTQTANIDQDRFHSSATVMADGRVMISGGSTTANQLVNVAYQSTIWDPKTGKWSPGATATKPRLYHSNALLMPDGSILTGGGGAPGPVRNLNAEIYYPSYLYLNDGSGQPAPRPSLASTPAAVPVGGTLSGTVGDTDQISRITFVREGSATHSFNPDQRFFDLPFTQTGNQIVATLPANSNVLVPGNYMMFAFNSVGTPSLAQVVLVTN